jgi:hypothetical protein
VLYTADYAALRDAAARRSLSMSELVRRMVHAETRREGTR